MGELDIQIKVLRENTPILFSWWNKEKETVEGCIVSCRCQDFGLYYSSCSKSSKKRKSDDCSEVLTLEGVTKFGEALQQAEIVTLPRGTENSSVLLKKRRTKQIWDSSVLGADEQCGNSKELVEDEGAGVRVGLEEKADCDGDFENVAAERKDGDDLEREYGGDIEEKGEEVVGSTTGDSKQCKTDVSKIARSGTVVDKDAQESQNYGMNGASAQSSLNGEDGKIGDGSEGILDSHQGEEHHEEGNNNFNSVERHDEEAEENHQLFDSSLLNERENTAPIIPADHGASDLAGNVAPVGQVVDVSTLSAESVVVLDEGKGSMSEVDSALYEALKGIIEVSQANESGPMGCHQVTQPSKHSPKKTSEPDVQILSDVNPVNTINTPAMIKYRKHKNEEYLKRLHQLRTMRKVVTIICEFCGALLTNKSFANHMAAFHSKEERERNYVCEICGKKFLRPENLERHSLTHTDSRAYCSYCDKSFKHDYSRKAHEKIHWEKPPPPPVRKPRYKTLNPKTRRKPSEIDEEYRHLKNRKSVELSKQEGAKDPKSKTVACSTCGKVVSRKSIRRHMRSHYLKSDSDSSTKSTSQSINVTCEVCGKVLRARNLKLHMNTVHNPKLIRCDICGKMVRNGSMYGHAKLHTKEKAHMCSYCSATFHFKSSLNAHLRKHTKERPIRCRFCDLTFSRYETRLNHERRHTGERPYKCNLCQKDWKDRGAYKQHMLKYHPGVPMMFKRGPYAPQNQGILEMTEQTEMTNG